MPRESTKQETVEAILDAAERLLIHYGYSKMTMSDLAEEAGIGVGTIYLHFPGKADVAIEVVDRSNRRVIEQLETDVYAKASPIHRLRNMLLKRILLRYEIVRQRLHPSEEMRSVIREHKAIQPNHSRWFNEEKRLFGIVLREGKASGVFEFGDTMSTAETILWAMDSLMPRNLERRDLDNPNAFREKAERLADFILCGLRPLDTALSHLL